MITGLDVVAILGVKPSFVYRCGIQPLVQHKSKNCQYFARSIFISPIKTPYFMCLFIVFHTLLKLMFSSFISSPSGNLNGLPHFAPICTKSGETRFPYVQSFKRIEATCYAAYYIQKRLIQCAPMLCRFWNGQYIRAT